MTVHEMAETAAEFGLEFPVEGDTIARLKAFDYYAKRGGVAYLVGR